MSFKFINTENIFNKSWSGNVNSYHQSQSNNPLQPLPSTLVEGDESPCSTSVQSLIDLLGRHSGGIYHYKLCQDHKQETDPIVKTKITPYRHHCCLFGLLYNRKNCIKEKKDILDDNIDKPEKQQEIEEHKSPISEVQFQERSKEPDPKINETFAEKEIKKGDYCNTCSDYYEGFKKKSQNKKQNNILVEPRDKTDKGQNIGQSQDKMKSPPREKIEDYEIKIDETFTSLEMEDSNEGYLCPVCWSNFQKKHRIGEIKDILDQANEKINRFEEIIQTQEAMPVQLEKERQELYNKIDKCFEDLYKILEQHRKLGYQGIDSYIKAKNDRINKFATPESLKVKARKSMDVLQNQQIGPDYLRVLLDDEVITNAKNRRTLLDNYNKVFPPKAYQNMALWIRELSENLMSPFTFKEITKSLLEPHERQIEMAHQVMKYALPQYFSIHQKSNILYIILEKSGDLPKVAVEDFNGITEVSLKILRDEIDKKGLSERKYIWKEMQKVLDRLWFSLDNLSTLNFEVEVSDNIVEGFSELYTCKFWNNKDIHVKFTIINTDDLLRSDKTLILFLNQVLLRTTNVTEINLNELSEYKYFTQEECLKIFSLDILLVLELQIHLNKILGVRQNEIQNAIWRYVERNGLKVLRPYPPDSENEEETIQMSLAVLKGWKYFALNFRSLGLIGTDLNQLLDPMQIEKKGYLNLTFYWITEDKISIIDHQTLLRKEKFRSSPFNWTEIKIKNIDARKIFSNMKNIKECVLDLSQTLINEENIKILVQQILPCLKNLERFALNLKGAKLFDNTLKQIPIFMPIETLKDYHLDLSSTNIRDTGIKMLAQKTLPKMKNPERFTLNLAEAKITDTSLSQLFMTDIENIKEFHLDLSLTQVTDKSIEVFAQKTLPSMKNLERFTLNLGVAQITDSSLSQLFMMTMENIKEFHLDLSRTQVTDKSIQVFAQKTLPSMKNLERFTLNLAGAQITDTSLSQLFMMTMESIKEFHVDLSLTQVTDKSIEVFAQKTLPSMKNLERFTLNLTGPYITDSSLIQLFMMTMENIKEFHLDLSWTRVTDKSIEVFAQKTLPSMKNLERFTLKLYKAEITDTSLSQLFMMTMENIKEFHLDLSWTRVVTDKSIEVFAQKTLPSMKNLERFTLNLAGAPITDSSLSQLFMMTMENIKEFHLDLSRTQVTDKSIQVFAQKTLPSVKNLERFTLNLAGVQITDTSLSQLFMPIKNKMGDGLGIYSKRIDFNRY